MRGRGGRRLAIRDRRIVWALKGRGNGRVLNARINCLNWPAQEGRKGKGGGQAQRRSRRRPGPGETEERKERKGKGGETDRRCRMDLSGPTTSVGTRTDYLVGPWDYPACATRHLMA
jgi:hypothetical protein